MLLSRSRDKEAALHYDDVGRCQFIGTMVYSTLSGLLKTS